MGESAIHYVDLPSLDASDTKSFSSAMQNVVNVLIALLQLVVGCTSAHI